MPPAAPKTRRSKFATRVFSGALTARRAAWIIGAFTLLVTVLATFLVWLLDRDDFPNLGLSAWWALQTVTTVGYGDYVPTNTEGRVIGAVVMIGGIGFLTVITATITAAFVENARRRLGTESEPEAIAEKLDEVLVRLERLERAVDSSGRQRGEDPAGGRAPDPGG